MNKCNRCGRPINPDDNEFSHVSCDEWEVEESETWLTSEERAEKEERIREYERKKYAKK